MLVLMIGYLASGVVCLAIGLFLHYKFRKDGFTYKKTFNETGKASVICMAIGSTWILVSGLVLIVLALT